MVAPLHHRVTHWAEHRFQGDLVHLRHGLPLLVGDMRGTATPERLAGAVLARLEPGVRASHGALIVAGEVLDARDVDAGGEALAEYETSLERVPRRLAGLYGAARSAKLAGDTVKAHDYYTQIIEETKKADGTRAEVREARAFAAGFAVR